MTPEMDGASLLFTAAASVSGTITEVDEIEWPVCAADGEEPVALSDDFLLDEPVTLIDGVPWWWCIRAGHALAPVGQLTARIAKRHDHSPKRGLRPAGPSRRRRRRAGMTDHQPERVRDDRRSPPRVGLDGRYTITGTDLLEPP